MKETPKAKQAWLDYLAMGAERSLEKLTQHYVAEHPKYSKSTVGTVLRLLSRWSIVHGWQSRLAEIADEERQAIIKRGIAEKQNRIDDYDDLRRRLKQVIDERAEQHPVIEELIASPAAGASSGLMVLTVRYLPGGGRVEEWGVDTGTIKALMDVNKQAAQEMGQWTEKKELTGKDGGAIQHNHRLDLSSLSDEELILLERITGKLTNS